MIAKGLLVTLPFLMAGTVCASISIDLVEVDNSANPILDGFRTYDLFITTDTHWTTSAMYLDLQQGSVYQDPWGSERFSAPNQATLDLLEQNEIPNGLEFDTYIAPPDVGQGNAATDVGGPWQTYPADTEGISWSWGTPQTHFDWAGLSSSGTQLAMRISLSDDAVGSWSFGATEVGTPQAKFLNNPINAGQMSYAPLQGDLTHDGFVGIEDLNNILSNWNMTADPGGEADPSGDGFVGIEDMNIVLGNWNAGTVRRPILITPATWGDLNGDGFVGIEDLKVPNSYWGLEVVPGTWGDASGDGFVGLDDLSIVEATWNFGAPPSTAVPEPGAIGLLGLGLAALLNRSRGRA